MKDGSLRWLTAILVCLSIVASVPVATAESRFAANLEYAQVVGQPLVSSQGVVLEFGYKVVPDLDLGATAWIASTHPSDLALALGQTDGAFNRTNTSDLAGAGEIPFALLLHARYTFITARWSLLPVDFGLFAGVQVGAASINRVSPIVCAVDPSGLPSECPDFLTTNYVTVLSGLELGLRITSPIAHSFALGINLGYREYVFPDRWNTGINLSNPVPPGTPSNNPGLTWTGQVFAGAALVF